MCFGKGSFPDGGGYALTLTAEEGTGFLAGLKKLLHFSADQTLRLTATVTGVDGKAQTGRVEFYSDGKAIGSQVLKGGQAAISVKELKLGDTEIYAVFTPDKASTDHLGGGRFHSGHTAF